MLLSDKNGHKPYWPSVFALRRSCDYRCFRSLPKRKTSQLVTERQNAGAGLVNGKFSGRWKSESYPQAGIHLTRFFYFKSYLGWNSDKNGHQGPVLIRWHSPAVRKLWGRQLVFRFPHMIWMSIFYAYLRSWQALIIFHHVALNAVA